MDEIDTFGYLWSSPNGPWVLVAIEGDTTLPVIFNQETRVALIVEDDDLYRAVVERMRDVGIRTISAPE